MRTSDDSRKRLLWAVRAALIAADAVASGLFREAEDLKAWIAERFENLEDCDAAYIRREIIDKRINNSATHGRAGISSKTIPPFSRRGPCCLRHVAPARRLPPGAGLKSRRDSGP